MFEFSLAIISCSMLTIAIAQIKQAWFPVVYSYDDETGVEISEAPHETPYIMDDTPYTQGVWFENVINPIMDAGSEMPVEIEEEMEGQTSIFDLDYVFNPHDYERFAEENSYDDTGVEVITDMQESDYSERADDSDTSK